MGRTELSVKTPTWRPLGELLQDTSVIVLFAAVPIVQLSICLAHPSALDDSAEPSTGAVCDGEERHPGVSKKEKEYSKV